MIQNNCKIKQTKIFKLIIKYKEHFIMACFDQFTAKKIKPS